MSAISGVAKLSQALTSAGIPIDGVGDITGTSTPYPPNWHTVTQSGGKILRIDYKSTATTAQIQQGDSIASTYDLSNKGPRPLFNIYTDLQALTATQKTNVWNDLSSGTPKKYFLDTGTNTAAIVALDWAATDSGATGAALTAARLRITAMYVQDNPHYLVNPTFDNTINVAGDQTVQTPVGPV